MVSIIQIEGIGKMYAEKLKEIEIATTEVLLERGATSKGRQEIANSTGISNKLVLRWVNMADLFRIKGVGEEYSDLLEAAGVDTVPELAQRNPENLHVKMSEVNEVKKLVRQLPSLPQVTEWVMQAKDLPRVMQY